jgi:hypothetical protein
MVYSDGVRVYCQDWDALDRWAKKHNINKCYLHYGRIRHFDIPKRRRKEVFKDVIYLSNEEIIRRGKKYA